jgi:hypothetical protein
MYASAMRLLKARRWRLGAAILLLASACIVKNGPKYPDVNSFCSARASAECSSEVLLACAIPDASTCTAKRRALCLSSVPPGTVYNPNSAENCVTQVTGAYADAKVTLAESSAIDAACLPVFDGPDGKDANCQKDSDCQVSTGLRCILLPGSAQGTCQVPQIVQGGGVCAAMNARCIAGFHCGPTAHCDINAAVGEACSPPIPCGPDLQCSSGGVCVNKTADGSMCATDDECLHGICNKSMTSSTGLCVSQVSLAPGEPFCVDSR